MTRAKRLTDLHKVTLNIKYGFIKPFLKCLSFLSVCVCNQVGMFKIHPEIPDTMSAEAKAFILRCFEPDPDLRATANELLMHDFLTVTSRKKKAKGNSFTGVLIVYMHMVCFIV